MPRPTMTRTTTAASCAPEVERPGPDTNPITGKPDWSRYNATVVGNLPVPNAPVHPVHAPGLEATQGPNAHPPPYCPVSFGGREYKNDEDGWQRVIRTKRRKWRGADE